MAEYKWYLVDDRLFKKVGTDAATSLLTFDEDLVLVRHQPIASGAAAYDYDAAVAAGASLSDLELPPGMVYVTASQDDIPPGLERAKSSAHPKTGHPRSVESLIEKTAWGEPGLLLTWNPDVWDDWEDLYPETWNEALALRPSDPDWSVARRTNIDSGTEFWLLRQGAQGRGVLGHGFTESTPWPPGGNGQYPKFVDTAFDLLIPVEDALPPEVLSDHVPTVQWRYIMSSGHALDVEQADQLRTIWNEHLRLHAPAPHPDR